MIYTKLTKKAMLVAYKAHENQLDLANVPYIYHPIHIAEKMDTEEECVIALLHDVVEDTDITFAYLERDFSKEIIDVLKLLTHEKNEPYMDYIKRIKQNKLATKIKIEDILHNMDETRLDKIRDNDIKRREKYRKALNYLESK